MSFKEIQLSAFYLKLEDISSKHECCCKAY